MCSLLPTVFKELYQRRPPRLCSLLWREAEADVCQWDKDTATQLAGAAGTSPSMSSSGNWASGFKPFAVTRTASLSGQNVGWQNAYFCQEFSDNSNILHSPYILALLQSVLKFNPFGCINICKFNVLESAVGHWGKLAQSKPLCVLGNFQMKVTAGKLPPVSGPWDLFGGGHSWNRQFVQKLLFFYTGLQAYTAVLQCPWAFPGMLVFTGLGILMTERIK